MKTATKYKSRNEARVSHYRPTKLKGDKCWKCRNDQCRACSSRNCKCKHTR